MALAERLAILINANGSQAIGEFKKLGTAAGSELGKAEGSAAKFGAGMTKVGLGMMAAGGVMVAAMSKAGKSAEDYGLQVAKLQRITGGTAREASLLSVAAQQTGVQVDDLAKAIGLASKNIESGKWDKLGIATKSASGDTLTLIDSLGNLADKLQTTTDAQKKNDLALQALGKGGMALLPMLQQGRDGFAAWAVEMDRAGLAMDESGIKKFKELKAAQRDSELAWQGFTVQVGQAAVPALKTLAETTQKVGEGFRSADAATGGAASQMVMYGGLALGAAGSVTVVAGMTMKVVVAAKAATTAISGMQGGIGMVAAKAGIAAVAIAGVTLYTQKWAQAIGEAKTEAEKIASAAKNRALADGYDATRVKVEQFQEQMRSVREESARLGIWDELPKRQLTELHNALAANNDEMVGLINRADELQRSEGMSAEAAFKQARAEKEKKDAIDAGIEPMEGMIGSTDKQSEAYKSLKERVSDVTSAMSDYFDEVNGNIDAEADWIESGQKLNAQLKEKGTGFSYVKGEVDLFTEAGRENLRVSQEFIEDASAFALAEYQRTGSLEVGRQKLVEVREAFIQSQMRANMSREAAEKYADQLGLIPDKIVTTWQANGLTEIELQMARVMDLAQRWQQTLGNVTFASDWVNAPAATAPSGSAIATAAGSIPGAMSRGAGTIIVNQNVAGSVITERDLGEHVTRAISNHMAGMS